jgi:hypothetical protein
MSLATRFTSDLLVSRRHSSNHLEHQKLGELDKSDSALYSINGGCDA